MNLGVELSYYSTDSVSVTVKGTDESSCRHNCVSLCLSHWKCCCLRNKELCCLSCDFNSQLNYLQGHSRSDITMANSQTAQYIHNPNRSHELALICIGRYLKGTLDKGLIFKPTDTESLQTDIYVDAFFTCGWGTILGTNPDSAKTRTGCIIEIANCPVVLVSKL